MTPRVGDHRYGTTAVLVTAHEGSTLKSLHPVPETDATDRRPSGYTDH